MQARPLPSTTLHGYKWTTLHGTQAQIMCFLWAVSFFFSFTGVITLANCFALYFYNNDMMIIDTHENGHSMHLKWQMMNENGGAMALTDKQMRHVVGYSLDMYLPTPSYACHIKLTAPHQTRNYNTMTPRTSKGWPAHTPCLWVSACRVDHRCQ